MVAFGNTKDLGVLDMSLEAEGLTGRFAPLGQRLSQIALEINNESSKQVKTGQLELHVKYICNGEVKKSTVTVLETFHRTITFRETIRKMLEAMATLEARGVNSELTLRSKKGKPLVTIKAQEQEQKIPPLKVDIYGRKTIAKELQELLRISKAQAVSIRDMAQLKAIDKFSDKLGIQKIFVPEKMLAAINTGKTTIEINPKIEALPKTQAIEILETKEALGIKQENPKLTAIPELDLSELKMPLPEIRLRIPRAEAPQRIQQEAQLVSTKAGTLLTLPQAVLEAPQAIPQINSREDLAHRQTLLEKIDKSILEEKTWAEKKGMKLRPGLADGIGAAMQVQKLLAGITVEKTSMSENTAKPAPAQNKYAPLTYSELVALKNAHNAA